MSRNLHFHISVALAALAAILAITDAKAEVIYGAPAIGIGATVSGTTVSGATMYGAGGFADAANGFKRSDWSLRPDPGGLASNMRGPVVSIDLRGTSISVAGDVNSNAATRQIMTLAVQGMGFIRQNRQTKVYLGRVLRIFW